MKRKSILSRPLNREELAWAAGFFDGEGSFTCSEQRWRYSKPMYATLRARLSQDHDNEAVDKLWESFGLLGAVYIRPHKNSFRYSWEVSGFEKVQFVAAAMWPWLCSPKKEQYKAALKTFKLFKGIA